MSADWAAREHAGQLRLHPLLVLADGDAGAHAPRPDVHQVERAAGGEQLQRRLRGQHARRAEVHADHGGAWQRRERLGHGQHRTVGPADGLQRRLAHQQPLEWPVMVHVHHQQPRVPLGGRPRDRRRRAAVEDLDRPLGGVDAGLHHGAVHVLDEPLPPLLLELQREGLELGAGGVDRQRLEHGEHGGPAAESVGEQLRHLEGLGTVTAARRDHDGAGVVRPFEMERTAGTCGGGHGFLRMRWVASESYGAGTPVNVGLWRIGRGRIPDAGRRAGSAARPIPITARRPSPGPTRGAWPSRSRCRP